MGDVGKVPPSKTLQKHINSLNFNDLLRCHVSLFLRIRIRDERLPRWTCSDWDDIQNERKKVVHGVKSGGLFEL